MRALSTELEQIQDNAFRQPAWKVYIYDIVSTKGFPVPDTISRLVQGVTLDAITGPLDFTDNVVSVAMTERSSNFTEGSLQGNSISMSVVDKNLKWDPVGGSQSRWLKPGNIIRILEGDVSLDESLWQTTFTGTIVGRAGASDRDRSDNQMLLVAAKDRMSTQLDIKITSEPFSQGTQYQFIMQSILETEVGMDSSEFDLAGVGARITSQATTQVFDESPMIAMAKFAFVDGFVPKFRGDGVLEFTNAGESTSVAVTYTSFDLFGAFGRRWNALADANEVEVIGLSADMTKIQQGLRELASATVTLGFFGGDARINVSWSEDDTQQADDVRLNIISSVTGALIPFGAENFTLFPDNDGGSRRGRIDVEGAFYAPLVVVLYAGSIAASFIPDNVPLTGATIPVGRLIEAILQILTSTIQATIGRGDYQIIGTPYEYVFEEIRGVARVGEFAFVDIRGISVENHLIDSQALADSIAMRELKTVRKRGNVWNGTMRHDLRLEPADKFKWPDGREFIISELSRVISRDNSQMVNLSLFETTIGVHP